MGAAVLRQAGVPRWSPMSLLLPLRWRSRAAHCHQVAQNGANRAWQTVRQVRGQLLILRQLICTSWHVCIWNYKDKTSSYINSKMNVTYLRMNMIDNFPQDTMALPGMTSVEYLSFMGWLDHRRRGNWCRLNESCNNIRGRSGESTSRLGTCRCLRRGGGSGARCPHAYRFVKGEYTRKSS